MLMEKGYSHPLKCHFLVGTKVTLALRPTGEGWLSPHPHLLVNTTGSCLPSPVTSQPSKQLCLQTGAQNSFPQCGAGLRVDSQLCAGHCCVL